MQDISCFVQPFGWCVSQQNAISAAFVTAVASFCTTAWKLLSASREARLRRQFEQQERAAREEFEKAIRREAREVEAVLKKDLETYVKREKWREESWERTRLRLDEASDLLRTTSNGLTALIELGPVYDDLRMISEAAKVLDVFGDFQTSVLHHSLPPRLAQKSSEVVSHVTKVLLTLSPSQEVRQSKERQDLLQPLKEDLKRLNSEFTALCSEFVQAPWAFIARVDDASSVGSGHANRLH